MNEASNPPLARGKLILATVGTLLLAVLVVLGAILPAEFNRDPLGVGRLSGLSRLWAPEERNVETQGAAPLAREYQTAYRTDVVEIPLGGFLDGADKSELEYKVRMRKGETLTYAWEVVGDIDPRDLRFDQHGHTTPKPGEGMDVASYRQGHGLAQRGALTAPFDGIQGWQFVNAGDAAVVMRLRMSGFYELVPPGEPGNEARVVANVPAAQAKP